MEMGQMVVLPNMQLLNQKPIANGVSAMNLKCPS
jgi:hypothetical protein